MVLATTVLCTMETWTVLELQKQENYSSTIAWAATQHIIITDDLCPPSMTKELHLSPFTYVYNHICLYSGLISQILPIQNIKTCHFKLKEKQKRLKLTHNFNTCYFQKKKLLKLFKLYFGIWCKGSYCCSLLIRYICQTYHLW